MGSITINGKQVKKWVIGGKTVKSLIINGKTLTLSQPIANINWHYGDGAGGPHSTKNDWSGTFSSSSKQTEFEAITDYVSNYIFFNDRQLTSISLPNLVRIGSHTFVNSPLTYIKVPKATTIGDLAFGGVINAASTNITINGVFNTTAEKNRIFGTGNWNNITFNWLGSSIQSSNSYNGIFSSLDILTAFLKVTDNVAYKEFTLQKNLTGITLPNVKTIGYESFDYSPLTYIKVPKATRIGRNAFSSAVNARTTEVWMNKIFDSDNEKDRIFGWYTWQNITFHWTNDDGTPA